MTRTLGAARAGLTRMTPRVDRRTLLGAGALAAAGGLLGCSRPDEPLPFPAVGAAGLPPRRGKVVDILRAEHAAQPGPSRYTTVTDEPWCADFVSWVEKQAGAPMTNPHSGGWRIPGTMTLREHLRATGAWHDAGSGYEPVVGDIAIYDGTPFGQHTNYVLDLYDDVLTTCGGNEDGGIRVTAHRLDVALHCLGFGHRV